MNRHSDPWSKSELIQLKKEYTLGKMTVDNISVIHSRLPDSIANKLKSLGIIQNINDARGYAYSNLNNNNINQNDTHKVVKHQEEFIQREYTRAMYGLTKRKPASKQEPPISQVWTDDEVIQLLKLVHAKKHIDEIAAIHLRTEEMITSKLKALAVDYHIYDKRSLSQIEKFTGLSRDTILAAIEENEKHDNVTSEEAVTVDAVKVIETVDTVEAITCSAEPFIKEIMTVMNTIQHDMKTIIEKIDGQNINSPNSNASDSNTLAFGKHKGKSYDFVKHNDVSYCNWVLKQKNFGGKMLHFQTWLKSQGNL